MRPSSPDRDRSDEGGALDGVLRWVAAREHALWAVVGAALLLDVASTAYGLRIGLSEANPVAGRLVGSFGVAGFGALKALAVAVAAAAGTVLPRPYRAVIPLGLAVPWTAAALNNAVLIAAVVTL